MLCKFFDYLFGFWQSDFCSCDLFPPFWIQISWLCVLCLSTWPWHIALSKLCLMFLWNKNKSCCFYSIKRSYEKAIIWITIFFKFNKTHFYNFSFKSFKSHFYNFPLKEIFNLHILLVFKVFFWSLKYFTELKSHIWMDSIYFLVKMLKCFLINFFS